MSDRLTPKVRVSLVAVEESSAAVLYGIHEVLASVGTAWEALTGEPPCGRSFRPAIVAASPQPFPASLGIPIAPDESFAQALAAEIVIVSDLALWPGSDPRGRWPEAAAWLRAQHLGGAMICSVCTGSVLLAEAGLLDGLEATSHWGAQELFRKHYPAVRLRLERIMLPAGPGGRIVTSGGSGSWADLVLYLVARYCGREEAVRTAKVFLLGDRSDGQLPFAAMPMPQAHEDNVVAACQQWIAGNYAEPSPVARMTERSGLPPRTFKRRFRSATGYTPIAYVQALRMEEAKQMLERTRVAVDDVAAAVGYEDPASFRRVFKRRTGVTPARYRRRQESAVVAAHLPPR